MEHTFALPKPCEKMSMNIAPRCGLGWRSTRACVWAVLAFTLVSLISTSATAQPLLHKLDFPAGTDQVLIALEASSLSRESKGRWLPYGSIHRAERDIVWKINSAVIKNGKLEVDLWFLTRDGRSYAAYCISFGGFDSERDEKLDLVLEKEGDNLVIDLPTAFDDTRRLILAPGTGIDDFRKRFSVSYTMPLFKWENLRVMKW